LGDLFGGDDTPATPSNLPAMSPNIEFSHENAATLKSHARMSSDGSAEMTRCFGAVNSTW
jgi:hypothetical protein